MPNERCKLLIFPLVFSIGFLLAACRAAAPTTQPSPTSPTSVRVPASPTAAPTSLLQTTSPAAPPTELTPEATPTSVTDALGQSSVPATPTSIASAGPGPTVTFPSPSAGTASPTTVSDQVYRDDRSTPEGLLKSYVDALNRKEYLRAYSYWEPGTTARQLPTFDAFQKGFADTQAIRLQLGQIGGDAGAGQIRFSVPVALTSQLTNGTTQTFVGCYILHLAQPAIQDLPPFQSLAIESAQVNPVSVGDDVTTLLAEACQAAGYSAGVTILVQPTPAPTDIDASRYLDDRSGPVEVVRSYFNAINRHEYDRAYSYWQPSVTAQEIPPYDQFKAGYQKTKSVTLTPGKVHENRSTAQSKFTVPVVLVSTTSSGATQAFVGCYTLQLSNPLNQATPPYQPLAIESATVQSVPNNPNTTALLGQACR